MRSRRKSRAQLRFRDMLVALVLAALPTYGPATAPPTTPPAVVVPTRPGEALIVRSASTNTAGYQLRVFANGTVSLMQGNLPLRRRVPAALAARFFADLRAAGNVRALPREFCMKSASFGTTLRVAYRGQTSPDLTCPGTSRIERALAEDADALASAAHVSIAPGPRQQP